VRWPAACVAEPMIYRKTPPQPGRLLLRIVATTGAGTLLGMAACGSSGERGLMGVLPNSGSGAEVSGSTGSASGSAGTGYEVVGSTGNMGVSGSTGSASGGSGAGTGYELAGSGTIGGGAGSNYGAPPQAEGGTADATVMEAGRIILGISVCRASTSRSCVAWGKSCFIPCARCLPSGSHQRGLPRRDSPRRI
jgi:hypothetical protein